MKRYAEMTIAELVAAAEIIKHGEHNLIARNIPDARKDEFMSVVKPKKAEIIAYLTAHKEATMRAASEREAKIAAIAGLAEIKAAEHALDEYRRAFNRMMYSEHNDGANAPANPHVDLDALLAKYPRAAAYRKAEEWSYAASDIKSSAGKRAMDRIIDGDDHAAAIADMEKEWGEHCISHLWD